MKQLGGFSEVLDEIEKNVKQGVKQQVKATVQATKTQVGQKSSTPQGFTGHASAFANTSAVAADAGANEAGQSGAQQSFDSAQDKLQSDLATKDFVKDLYGPSQSKPQGNPAFANASAGKASRFFEKQVAQGKTPEEAQQIETLRKRLHDETYYVPLTRRKPAEIEHKEEKQVKEQEKMQELQVEEEKKKDEIPLAVQMGAQKAEKYPGASG